MIPVPNVWGRRWWWSIKNPSMWWKGRMAALGSLGVFQTVVDSQRCKEFNETLELVSTCLNKSWHLQNFWRSQGLAMLAKLPIFINFLVDFKTFVARKKSGDLVSSGRSCMATCRAPCTGQSAELYCPVGQLGKERIPWEVYQFGVLLPFLPLQTHRIVNIVHNIQHFIETVKSCGILYRRSKRNRLKSYNFATLYTIHLFWHFFHIEVRAAAPLQARQYRPESTLNGPDAQLHHGVWLCARRWEGNKKHEVLE